MLIAESVKIGNLTIWSKVMDSHGRFATDNGYNSPYNLYLFTLFFPHKSYRFNTLLTIILILGNWYICLILSRVLWISGYPYNGYLYISRINYFYSFRDICNLLLFSFCYSLYFRICQCRSLLLLAYTVMLAKFLYRK